MQENKSAATAVAITVAHSISLIIFSIYCVYAIRRMSHTAPRPDVIILLCTFMGSAIVAYIAAQHIKQKKKHKQQR